MKAAQPTAPQAIVIGASAGGVEALGVLLQALPPWFRAAVFVVLHLPADRVSLLPQLFARRCLLPVKEGEDKEAVEPGVVYLAPPDYHLLVEPDRTLALSRADPVHFSRPAVDPLFESAALAYREGLIAIVLSGASADGAEGLKQVREAGGAAWVQDPAEAASDVMPASAISRAGADLVLPVARLAQRLAELFRKEEEGAS